MNDEDTEYLAEFQLAPASDPGDPDRLPMTRARLDALIAETNRMLDERHGRTPTVDSQVGAEPPAVVSPVFAPPILPPAVAPSLASPQTPGVAQAVAAWRQTNCATAPDPATVRPCQYDSEVEAFLSAWMAANRRKRDAAEKVYAGILGATAPRQEDSETDEQHREAYASWLARCTPKQRAILDAASAARKARVRAADSERARLEYAARAAKEGRAVRSYMRHVSEEDKAAARKRQYRESKQRRRAAETPEQTAVRRRKDAERKQLLRDLKSCPDV